jgi:RNA polymerase sigma-70 factor, ECF subfamily
MPPKPEITEDELVALLRERSEDGFNLLYERYSAALYGVVTRIVKSEEAAQDVIQDAFVKIWKSFSGYDKSKGSLFTWILNVARNTAIDYTRSKHVRHNIQNGDAVVSMGNKLGVSNSFDHIGLKEQVEKMKAEHREVIDLLYFEGYTHEEASKHLNLPLGTVKTRIRTAVQQLRSILTVNPSGH